MRHRIYGKQLNRTTQHRKAMLRNLAAGLFEHGEIETTLPKAKAVQPFVEKLITMVKKSKDMSKNERHEVRRRVEARLTDRKLFAWMVDPNVSEEKKLNAWFDLPQADQIEFNRYGELRKAPRLVQHLFERVAPLFEDRDGGYTRIVKLDKHRLGDGTDLVLLQMVGKEEGPQSGGGVSIRRKTADKRTAFAATLRKAADAAEGGGGAAVAEAVETTEEAAVPEAETAGDTAASEDETTSDES